MNQNMAQSLVITRITQAGDALASVAAALLSPTPDNASNRDAFLACLFDNDEALNVFTAQNWVEIMVGSAAYPTESSRIIQHIMTYKADIFRARLQYLHTLSDFIHYLHQRLAEHHPDLLQTVKSWLVGMLLADDSLYPTIIRGLPSLRFVTEVLFVDFAQALRQHFNSPAVLSGYLNRYLRLGALPEVQMSAPVYTGMCGCEARTLRPFIDRTVSQGHTVATVLAYTQCDKNAWMDALLTQCRCLLIAQGKPQTQVDALIQMLKQFWQSHTPLHYKRADKFNLIDELARLVVAPYHLDQGEAPLCGPVALVMVLLNSAPVQCVAWYLELLQTGAITSDLPFVCHASSRDRDGSFVPIFLGALRNGSNRMLPYVSTPYVPALFKTLMGVTHRDESVHWLILAGFTQIKYTYVVHSGKQNEKLAKANYQPFVNVQTCIDQIQAALDLKQSILLAVKGDFFLSNFSHASAGIDKQLSHVFILREMTVSDDGVTFTCWSNGRERKVTKTLDAFAQHYHGHIMATPPSVPALSATLPADSNDHDDDAPSAAAAAVPADAPITGGAAGSHTISH